MSILYRQRFFLLHHIKIVVADHPEGGDEPALMPACVCGAPARKRCQTQIPSLQEYY
jgi:hypothetical protein